MPKEKMCLEIRSLDQTANLNVERNDTVLSVSGWDLLVQKIPNQQIKDC